MRGLAAISIVFLSACGGGSGESSLPDNTAQAALAGPLQGFIAIEERAGKRVFDAWFSRGSSITSAGLELWSAGSERCVDSGALTNVEGGASSQTGSRWRDTLFAGETVRIQSRGGDVVTLQAQRYEDAVMYATADRWLAQALPDDSQLTVVGSDQFPAFGPVGLAPLTPLISSQPTGGYSTDVTQAIVWEASADTSDDIQLKISTLTSDSSKPAQTIRCWLDDSGRFTLPELVVQHLPDNPQITYSLVRLREAIHESGGAKLHVSQVSYP